MRNFIAGFCFAISIAFLIASITVGKRADACQARVSSEHVSLCLDGTFAKAKELVR
jgi:hypothetical protein